MRRRVALTLAPLPVAWTGYPTSMQGHLCRAERARLAAIAAELLAPLVFRGERP